MLWATSHSWLVRANFPQAKTYPKVSVLGANVGGLGADQLDKQLIRLKSEFESRDITLVNGKDKWVFNPSKLGVTFDVRATSQTVWRLNDISFLDKYQLLNSDTNSVIKPTILIDNGVCVKSLSAISISKTEPQDASIYFNQGIKINPDRPGTEFNAVSACRELFKQSATDLSVADVYLETTPANITKADLEPKLFQIQSMAGESLSLENGADYKQTLTPERLLGLLEISKGDSGVQANWSSAKLDEFIDSIANEVNTYSSSPALGGCQRLVSVGGNWLDKAATKKIFTDLGADSPRSYNLPVTYHAPVVNTISPVGPGNSGVIYLTFDDGLAYGDQIMNYAACYGVKVTFFELGVLANRDAVALRRAIAEGHTVQSHGYEHALFDYGQRSYDWQYNDIRQSIDAIAGITGVRPTYFRPPGGNRSATTYDAAGANGINLILWGVSSGDGANIGASATCSNVLARAFSGATVLLHSSKGDTTAAVPCIIEGLAARGYNMQALR